MKLSRPLAVSILLVLLGACGSHHAPAARAPAPPPVLHPPSSGAVSFVTEQVVEATHDGRTHTFRAVVEKEGDRLLIVILTSFGVRAVTLTQEGREVRVERHLSRDLPFPPEYVAADVAKSLIVGLPLDAPDGVVSRSIDGEVFEDRIEGGALRERRIHPETSPGPVTDVRYDAPGLLRDGTPPSRFEIESEGFGYRLVVTTSRYRATPPR